jgi:hypothetical protein
VLFVCKCVLYYCHRLSPQLHLTNISKYFTLSTVLWIPVATSLRLTRSEPKGRMILRLKMLTATCTSFSPSTPTAPYVFIDSTGKWHWLCGRQTACYLQRILLHFHNLFTGYWCFWQCTYKGSCFHVGVVGEVVSALQHNMVLPVPTLKTDHYARSETLCLPQIPHRLEWNCIRTAALRNRLPIPRCWIAQLCRKYLQIFSMLHRACFFDYFFNIPTHPHLICTLKQAYATHSTLKPVPTLPR